MRKNCANFSIAKRILAVPHNYRVLCMDLCYAYVCSTTVINVNVELTHVAASPPPPS